VKELNKIVINNIRVALYFLEALFNEADRNLCSVKVHPYIFFRGYSPIINPTCFEFFRTTSRGELDGIRIPIKTYQQPDTLSDVEQNMSKRMTERLREFQSEEIEYDSETISFRQDLFNFLKDLIVANDNDDIYR
jgi:hypothetical protein